MYIIVDLDGTLFDCSHRVDFARTRQWDEFHCRLADDKVFADVEALLKTTTMNVIALTGRNERWRQLTVEKINSHALPIEELLMRPDDDWRQDGPLKTGLLEERFGNKEEVLRNVAFCIDDRDSVVEHFRNYGLSCWQVRTGDY